MSGIVTRIYSTLFGENVGTDEYGNSYYRSKPTRGNIGRIGSERRWVIFNGKAEPSKVPPYWHGWLHHNTDELPSNDDQTPVHAWHKPHMPNLSGTKLAYYPSGHIRSGAKRSKATGDYTPWTPDTKQEKT